MSHPAATITSLPMAFEVVKVMQADGLEWGDTSGEPCTHPLPTNKSSPALATHADIRGCQSYGMLVSSTPTKL